MKRRGAEVPLFLREGFRVSSMGQYSAKFIQHCVDISLDFLIRKSDNINAQIIDDICPQLVILFLVVMILAVNLHN